MNKFFSLALLTGFFALYSKLRFSMGIDRTEISISSEQRYWNNLIQHKINDNCFLEPFVFFPLKNEIKTIEQAIKNSNKKENEFLFIVVSINNGVNNFHYMSWDENGGAYYIHGNLNNGNTSYVKNNIEINQIISLVNKLPINGDFYDPGQITFDSYSAYLTIRRGKMIARYATYDAEINYENQKTVIKEFSEYIYKSIKKGTLTPLTK